MTTKLARKAKVPPSQIVVGFFIIRLLCVYVIVCVAHVCFLDHMLKCTWRPEEDIGFLFYPHSLIIPSRYGLSLSLVLGWQPARPCDPPVAL